MIQFPSLGPALVYVHDFFQWIQLGYCEVSPEIKIFEKFRPVDSAARGEESPDDRAFQGKEAVIDCRFNLFDERLINLASAAPSWKLFSPRPIIFSGSPQPFIAGGGVGIPNVPANPLGNPSRDANRMDGVFDRLDYGSLASEQLGAYPLCVLFTKFKTNYAGRSGGNPPGYTFFQVRPETAVDEYVGTTPHVKRILFSAVPHSVDFPDQAIFRRWSRKKGSFYPQELLELSNYYLDPAYTARQATNGVLPGGQALYVRGVPKTLPSPVDPSSTFPVGVR